MPIHDWTRVSAGTFHDFHGSWITHIKEALNQGVLPAPYYALSEQHAGEIIPDILTLSAVELTGTERDREGGLALAEAPPKVALRMSADEADTYRTARRTIAIRHSSGHRMVAMIEILSPGNKDGEQHLSAFAEKAVACLREGIHLLLVDLFPPGPFDPDGVHGSIWEAYGMHARYELPSDKPLTQVSYRADLLPEAFIQPAAVGDPLHEMPIFLTTARYVGVPLESTYQDAFRGVPEVWRSVIERHEDA